MEELSELKLGSMSMDEYENNFLELLRYVGFIKEEKVKMQTFLSVFLHFTGIKFSMMNLLLLKKQFGRPSTCMIITKEGKIFKILE